MSIKQDHIVGTNKMVSSIEFLVKEINQIIDFIPMNKWDEIRVVVQQAKAMHRVEIIESYASGSNDRLRNTINTNYYNETFGE